VKVLEGRRWELEIRFVFFVALRLFFS